MVPNMNNVRAIIREHGEEAMLIIRRYSTNMVKVIYPEKTSGSYVFCAVDNEWYQMTDIKEMFVVKS